MVMLGLTIVAIGNLLPRTRPNVVFGVRTTRTLSNAQLWQQVHRVGGYVTVGLGVIIAVAGLMGSGRRRGRRDRPRRRCRGDRLFVSYRKYALLPCLSSRSS